MWAKLLVLVIAVAAVWYGFKFFGRPRTTVATPRIESTVKCPRCGVYVPSVNAVPCGREACPYLASGGSGAP